MADSLYDKCDCGATKLASEENCTNCWLDSQHYDWIVGRDKCPTCGKKTKSGSTRCSECLKIKNGICAKEDCNNRFTGARGQIYCALHLPSRKGPPVPYTSVVSNKETKKCMNCKNHAKKGHDLCSPCQKTKRGICRKKDCSNRVSLSKGHRYCGLHQPAQNSKGTIPNRTRVKEASKGKFVCDVCGKQHIGGNIAKGAQKAVGGSIMGIFGTLTMLTGGLTAPLMLGAATAGAALYGAAENYSTCSECRNK